MSEWAAKRFYEAADVVEESGGYTVTLDTRSLRTPAKAPLTLPSRSMAEAIAAEWMAQEAEINPLTMPVTRSANAAIDKVAVQHAEVARMLATYAETDLLSHRADSPEGLVAQQKAMWDPLLSWAEHRLDAPLRTTIGILPVDQPPDSLQRLMARTVAHDPFELTALSDLVSLSGSLVIALWVSDDPTRADAGWTASRVDEDWQIAQWGEDEEATEVAIRRKAAFDHAARFLTLARA